MKLIFFSSGKLTLSVIDKLSKEFEVILFTTEKEKNHPLIKFCIKKGIKYISFSSISATKIKKEIKKINSKIALTASFKWLIPKEILDLFEGGVLNIHPSLLPKYRGATPAQSTILNGDKKTGVSIFKLDEKMDHGSILWQEKAQIKNTDTGFSLYLRLFKLASESINSVLKSYLKGSLTPIPQDETKATYAKTLNRDSGFIDINSPPDPKVLEKMIRAYFLWPGVWTKYDNLRIKLLPDKKLQVEGKKPINLKDFKNGYPKIYPKLEKLLQ